MPKIYAEAQYIKVDVDEFLSDCDHHEINEVIEYLRDNEHIKDDDLFTDPPRGYNERKFEDALIKLKGNNHFLTTVEEEFIIKLSEKIP